MFHYNLKKEALKTHEKTLQEYNDSYKNMQELCKQLYDSRNKSIDLIKFVQHVINSIVNTPKEFDTKLGKIGKELISFNKTEQYAKKSDEFSIKTRTNIVIVGGVAVASLAPTALMRIATTFGTTSTGTAISALSGAAAQKAAVAWIGRNFAGFAVKQGAGMAVGKTFLALAGPIGWGIAVASTGFSLVSLSNENKELADNIAKETREISSAKKALDEITEKIKSLKLKTDLLYHDINKQRNHITEFMNLDYMSISDDDKYFLGSLVNNTLSLSVLLNESVK